MPHQRVEAEVAKPPVGSGLGPAGLTDAFSPSKMQIGGRLGEGNAFSCGNPWKFSAGEGRGPHGPAARVAALLPVRCLVPFFPLFF